MKIGYPCINRTLTCSGNKTFRLKSYSEERLIETVDNNLNCLGQMLKFNLTHNLLYFRISSDTVPFASHPVCQFDWVKHFKDQLEELGRFIKENKMRISMHPDQFIVLNSQKEDVVERSVAELIYHAQFLDGMNLDRTAKIQLHVGGVYGDKESAIERFVKQYKMLPDIVRNRLVVENDDKSYCLNDCFKIHEQTGVPLVFDSFHHSILNCNEALEVVMNKFVSTWDKKDGIPILDYSSQQPGERTGRHTESIDLKDFKKFIKKTMAWDFDIMLEIKDKEKSAIKAINIIKKLDKFINI